VTNNSSRRGWDILQDVKGALEGGERVQGKKKNKKARKDIKKKKKKKKTTE